MLLSNARFATPFHASGMPTRIHLSPSRSPPPLGALPQGPHRPYPTPTRRPDLRCKAADSPDDTPTTSPPTSPSITKVEVLSDLPEYPPDFLRRRWITFLGIVLGYSCFYLTRNSLTYTAPVMVADKALGLTMTDVRCFLQYLTSRPSNSHTNTPIHSHTDRNLDIHLPHYVRNVQVRIRRPGFSYLPPSPPGRRSHGHCCYEHCLWFLDLHALVLRLLVH